MKFCKDCKYHRANFNGPKYATCTAPGLARIDPVTGKPGISYALVNRSFTIACGPSANRFEQKPPSLWKRWFGGAK